MTTQNVINRRGPTPVCSYYLSANQTVASGSFVVLNFDTAIIDTTSAFNTSTHRFVPVQGGTTIYYASLIVQSIAPATVNYTQAADIRYNGSTRLCENNQFTVGVINNVYTLFTAVTVNILSAGSDYLDFTFFQNTGSDMSVVGGSATATRCDIYKVCLNGGI